MAKRNDSAGDGSDGKWRLVRAHAYAVWPQRTSDTEVPPRGGILRVDDNEIAAAIGKVLLEIEGHRFSRIELDLDGASRTSPVRDNLLAYAFGIGRQISKAAYTLADHLSESMDQRSPDGLLIVTVQKSDTEQRRVNIVLFDHEQALHFEDSRMADAIGEAEVPREVAIKFLDNTFSAGTKCRKVARFEGRNNKTQFLGGDVYDFQEAEFWLKGFLRAKFQLNAQKGVQLLADGLRAAFTKATPADREAIFAAVVMATRGQNTACSLEEFADKHLPLAVRGAFLKVAPNEATRQATFELDPSNLRGKLNYRIFELESGVFVSSPFSAVGESVTLDTTGKSKILHCRGVVLNEKVSTRKA